MAFDVPPRFLSSIHHTSIEDVLCCQRLRRFYRLTGRPRTGPIRVSLLPDSRIHRVTRSPVDTPGGSVGKVLIFEFTLAGTPFIAFDTPGFTFTQAVSFPIAGEDQAETDRLWAALTADGGSGIACGWLKDRWGVFWQVTPTRLKVLRDVE